jgi:thioredoxin reductase
MNFQSRNLIPVAIVGAGPYGLSLAAHLRHAGIPFRIFGRAMHSWQTQMPAGMKLKSDGFASNLETGAEPYTLAQFCHEHNRPYADLGFPIAVEDFADYGLEFARRFVPTLEEQDVASITREGRTFHLTLEDGSLLEAANVVLATGVSLFQHTPVGLMHLSPDFVTHTASHRTFDRFAGEDVVVLGRGASALNAAVLLHEADAHVTLISRHPKIHVHHVTAPTTRSLLERLRAPSSPLGYGKRSWLWSTFPGFFRVLPGLFRRVATWKHLGPSAGTALSGKVEGFEVLRGWKIESAELVPDAENQPPRIRLRLCGPAGEIRILRTGHIIAGTGYRVDLSRLKFLSPVLRKGIDREQTGEPALNRSFESTVPGLYFIGPAGQGTFGPLFRFTAGAAYACPRVTRALARRLRTRQPATSAVPQPS